MDAYKLWQADKTKPLAIWESSTGFTCAICEATQEPHSWRVTLPDRLGKACPGCASDRGWTVK